MSGHTSEDSNPFGGRRGDRSDPFESMREQMEKERENFFKGANPRDWPSENSSSPRGGGLFNRHPRTSFGGFPSGPGMRVPVSRYGSDFPDDFEGFGILPGSNSLPRNRKSSNFEDDVSDHSSNCSGHSNHSTGEVGGDSSGGGGGSIPINVVHEKTLPKHKYGQTMQRNTTELPAKAATSTGNESPRLERAHSEPPNKFKQRLNLVNPLYSTIPENSESGSQAQNRPNHQQVDPRNPIKNSASAPSVPTSSQHQQQESQPVPPPRRSPPRMSSNVNNNQLPPGQPTNSASNVRHIPIFVEGRTEPIFNTNVNVAGANEQGQQQAPSQDMSFPKPSDYYPAGVQRVKSRDGTLTPETPNFKGADGPFASQTRTGQKPVIPTQEPITPQGPPPGPIPMGYMPNPERQIPEPTTPQGPPPGPIPMGYLPKEKEEQDLNLNSSNPQAKEEPPAPPQRNRTLPQQNIGGKDQERNEENTKKEEAADSAAAAAAMRKPSNPESKQSKEPVVNFIPIKVEHSGPPDSPKPKENHRAATQQNQATTQKPGRSPTPVRSTPQPEPQPQTPKDPKIAKLDKIKAEVEVLMEQINNFKGQKKDKEYLYLDEMLTRHLIALDGIEPEGQVEIRQLRKESIKSVNRCLSLLDQKVSESNAEENNQVLSELASKSEELSLNNGDSSPQNS